MMAALTNRGRQVEILQKMWQNKDAKTGMLMSINSISFEILKKVCENFFCIFVNNIVF